jgi:hypothetical protein
MSQTLYLAGQRSTPAAGSAVVARPGFDAPEGWFDDPDLAVDHP